MRWVAFVCSGGYFKPMIKNFEEITAELTAVEVELLEVLKEHLLLHDETRPCKAYEIVNVVNSYCDLYNVPYRLHESRLRKMVNALRSTGTLPVIATAKGYFVSYNKQIIADQIDSLCQRANSIASCASGLQIFL